MGVWIAKLRPSPDYGGCMWPWQTILASAVGAAIPLIPIYLLGFKQIIAGKDTTIEQLKGQVERLESEQVVEVIREKQLLIEDVKARAKEKQEIEAETQRQIDEITVKIQGNNVALQTLHTKLLTVSDDVSERISTSSQLGVLIGQMSLIKTLYWFQGLFETTSDPILKSLVKFVKNEAGLLGELQLKLRDGKYILKVEDVQAEQQKMSELREQACAERIAINSGEPK
jgi:hypothetical protein